LGKLLRAGMHELTEGGFKLNLPDKRIYRLGRHTQNFTDRYIFIVTASIFDLHIR
jgi:hypothetical protein